MIKEETLTDIEKQELEDRLADAERDAIIDLIISSDDENVDELRSQLITTVKLIHSDKLARTLEQSRQDILNSIARKRQKRNYDDKEDVTWKNIPKSWIDGSWRWEV